MTDPAPRPAATGAPMLDAAPGVRRWRVLMTPHDDGAFNMALDELLMARAVESGEWVFRVYGWAEPTVSFGRNQSALRLYDPARIAARGYAVVRRPTGGRAILHHREITYSVTARVDAAGDLHESYLSINHLLMESLRRIGVDPAMAPGAQVAPLPGAIPCFDHPSAGELVAGGRKLVGSAQWRSGEGLLQHGSILVDDDQAILTSLLTDDARRTAVEPPRAATLRELLGEAPPLEAMRDAVLDALRQAGESVEPMELEPSLRTAAGERAMHYRHDEWVWRR